MAAEIWPMARDPSSRDSRAKNFIGPARDSEIGPELETAETEIRNGSANGGSTKLGYIIVKVSLRLWVWMRLD